ncbi:hypothetical protein C8A03DRAFT_33675 [Achaetomium macrosporum]|uniref:Uncharacterized protein n=1 Tax=Achaetomium macrosporum TaxID=79813 RepID=A0AAN7CBJ3_9PEZI|nr:hypothetical protein C8A03DRAFT_33675 [Achaetomium macrosporum]
MPPRDVRPRHLVDPLQPDRQRQALGLPYDHKCIRPELSLQLPELRAAPLPDSGVLQDVQLVIQPMVVVSGEDGTSYDKKFRVWARMSVVDSWVMGDEGDGDDDSHDIKAKQHVLFPGSEGGEEGGQEEDAARSTLTKLQRAPSPPLPALPALPPPPPSRPPPRPRSPKRAQEEDEDSVDERADKVKRVKGMQGEAEAKQSDEASTEASVTAMRPKEPEGAPGGRKTGRAKQAKRPARPRRPDVIPV